MLLKSLFALILSVLISGNARAAEIYEGFQTIRQLGMGGVYVFDPYDGGSFNVNPAYTCYTKGMNWEILNLGFGMNGQDIYELVQDNSDISGIEDLGPFYGKPIWLGLGGYTAFTIPCFGLSFFNHGYSSLSLNNPAFPIMNINAFYDYGYALGGAVPLGKNLSLGLSAKRINRRGGPISLGVADLVNVDEGYLTDLLTDIENEGVGYGLNAGLVARFEDVPLNPTASLSWQDIGSTRFTRTAGTDAPPAQKDNLTLGMTVSGDIPLLGFAAGFEYRHITDSNEQLGKKLHMGVEATLALFDVRAGFYQGYTTYGAGVNLWIFDLDAAMYTVEMGAYPGQTPQERLQMSLSMDLSFDPDFKMMEIGGKRRKLKQRR